MNKEILDKLHTALYTVSPLASDRDRIIEGMGETIWLETLEKALAVLNDEARGHVVQLLNDGKLDEAVEVMMTHNVDIDAIITQVSTSVLEDVLLAAKG